MFESLSTRLQDAFRNIRGQGRLTEETVELALREIRMALLEADVNFKVVKAFIDRVRDRAVDQEVLKSLTAEQQVVRIVRDEMLALFGDAKGGLAPTSERPRVVMLLDLNMPMKNGFDVLKWVCAQPMLKRMSIVILTASMRMEDVEQAFDLGAHSFLVKPSNLKDMINTIRYLRDWIQINHFPPLNDAVARRRPSGEKLMEPWLGGKYSRPSVLG